MPTITISIDSTVIGTSVLSPTDFTRVANAAIADRKGCMLVSAAIPAVPGTPAVLNPDGTVKTPAVPDVPAVAAVYRDPTANEAINFKAQDFFGGLLMNAMAKEQAAAAQAAIAAVKPIVVS